MVIKICEECGREIKMFPCRAKKSIIFFCSNSCHMTYKNKTNNPSLHRDLKGESNPMFGRHPIAWNKGKTGYNCHNWKGGLHKRKDGYYRINIKGERKLYHRYLLGLDKEKVVHHKDHNPSNNSIENLMVFNTQAEHVAYENK